MALHDALAPKMLTDALLYMSNGLSNIASLAARTSEFIYNIAEEHLGNKGFQ